MNVPLSCFRGDAFNSKGRHKGIIGDAEKHTSVFFWKSILKRIKKKMKMIEREIILSEKSLNVINESE